MSISGGTDIAVWTSTGATNTRRVGKLRISRSRLNGQTLFSILDCPLRRRNMPKAKSKQPNSNPTASTKADPKVAQILATLSAHREMGRDIVDRKLKIKASTVEKGIPERALRTRRAFFLAYKSENEFQRFCKLRFNGSKRPLDSSYIKYLLTIKGPVPGFGETAAEARYAFAEHAAINDLSPAQLHDLIKRKCGRPKASHGRKYRPKDKASAIEDIAREALKWIKRCEAAIELIPSNSRPSQTMVTLLREFSQWTSNAAELCEVPKDNEKKSESLWGSMESSREKILTLHSSCVARLKVKNA